MSKQEFRATSVADWARSDDYQNSFLLTPDAALDAALAHSAANGLPEIAVSAAQGKLLNLLATTIGAKRILEVGTLGGCVLAFLLGARMGPD
jgi:predicted O-methyltransferase YrrM